VEEQRKEQDMGIETRQDMVDLKEREAEEAERRAQAQEQAAAQEREAIEQERERLAQERGQREQEAAASGDDGDDGEDARREQELARREEAVAQTEEDAQQSQAFAEQKTAEAQQERREIAQDQQELINNDQRELINNDQRELANNEEQEIRSVLFGAVLGAADSPLGKIVQLDAATGAWIKDSEAGLLNIRTINIVNGDIIALSAHDDSMSYRLVKIAIDTLETVERGADAISVHSLLWVSGNDLYAIAASNDAAIAAGASGPASFYLARFDSNLKLQAASSVAVHPFASIMFYRDRLLTESADGGAIFLNLQTLEEYTSIAQ
ncbi:MAG: hypothetical protein LBD58_01990, partial [Treponema sp.]|jgi:hypothetical protein|nr:hypothetical protein [Treponema sp.]